MNSSADVKKAVTTDPNTIGYIEKSAVDGSVKVILDLQ
jgi:ABC-type phosphate transport system substrate-binding protein